MKVKRTFTALLLAFVVTWTVTCPVFAVTASGVDTEAYAAEVLRLINEKRTDAGLPALISSAALNGVAQQRCEYYIQDRNNYTTCPDGRDLSAILFDRGISYRNYWHNLAYGWNSPAQVVNYWMNNSNCQPYIMDSKYKYTGISVMNNNGTLFWVQYYVDSSTSPDGNTPTQPPTEAPTQPPTEPPTDPPEPPTEPPTQPPTDPPEPPTEPPTQPPTEPPTQPPTEPPTQPPTEPPTQPPTEPPTEPPTDPPESVNYGDVNNDTSIDSLDAYLVLLAAADMGAGKNPTLSDTQKLAANVNSDSEIDAADASYILRYSVLVGAGIWGVTMEGVVNGWFDWVN